MKVRLILILAFVHFLIINHSYGQVDTSYVYTFETAEYVNPYDVYKLSMVKYLSEKKNLPKDILKYSNCKVLYLSAPTKRIIKGRQYFGDTKFKEFPSWLTELNSIERIEILGNPDFKFEKELTKLKDLKSLRVLELEPEEVEEELIMAIMELKQLKELIIHHTISPEDQLVMKISDALPECKIVIVN